jgi:RHS repeat-associated protein
VLGDMKDDDAGDLTPDGVTSYVWNGAGLLKSAGSTTYTYDGDGKRVMNSAGTYYWTTPSGNQLSDTPGSGAGNEYIYFAGRRIAWVDSGGTVRYYWGDHLGTTRIVTDASGNVCYDADYYPFQGERTPYVSACTPAYRFAGMKFDQESGDYYTLNRYYPPNLGRWLSPDPLAGDVTNPQSLNRYAYVLNNPASLVDPSGLDAVKIMEPGGGTACEFFAWECGGGGAGVSTDPSNDCSYLMTNDASCQQAPGLFNNGQPIYPDPGSGGGGSGFGSPWPINTDYGPIQPLSPGQLLGLLLPIGASSPECDPFGFCGGPTWNPFASDTRVVNGEFTIYVTVMELMELPLYLATLRNAGRIAAPVASPAAPLVWYGGSAAVAVGGSAGYIGVELWAMTHPDQWMWILRFGGAALNGGPPASWPAILGQLGRKGWNWWWNL